MVEHRIPRNATFPTIRHPDNYGVYVEAFYRAATTLLEQYKERHGRPDFDVYPILFSYRHSLELKLKELLRASCSVGEMVSKVLPCPTVPTNTHGLKKLYLNLRGNLSDLEQEINLGSWPFDQGLIDLIEDFDRFDPISTGARYPLHIEKPGQPNESVIDLEQVSKTFERLYQRMSAVESYLDEVEQAIFYEIGDAHP